MVVPLPGIFYVHIPTGCLGRATGATSTTFIISIERLLRYYLVYNFKKIQSKSKVGMLPGKISGF
jgi:hypothetical protein